ncbi:MAG: Wzy polymerase domain-containing protein, partial [Brachymonas sp.]|nr:Wzy polymerase domain-containing protein [Brachymonas sp.]
TVLWSNVLQLIAQKPWWGWGWGELDYAHYQATYPGMRFCDLLDNAHNLPLHLAVELGVPIAVLACGAALIWIMWSQPWAEVLPQRQLMWGVLLTIGLHSLFEYPLWHSHFQLATGLAVGVLLALRRVQDRNAVEFEGQGSTALTWAQRALTFCLLAGLIYASFDFVRVTQLYTAAEDRVWPFRQDTHKQAARSFLYRNAVQFADVSTTEVTPEKAGQQLAQAQVLMHYSPEARVISRVIEALRMLGRDEEAAAAEAQFKAVYPQAHAQWMAGEKGQQE